MSKMRDDHNSLQQLSEKVTAWNVDFQSQLANRPVGILGDPELPNEKLSIEGNGAEGALADFHRNIAPYLSGAAGPRYLGFVTGGTTPAAMLADWIVSTTDQNLSSAGDSISSAVELQALSWLREMFVLPDNFEGIITTGATASNVLGALCGRQYAGNQQGLDIARDGLSGADIEVFAATPHASMQKAMAFAGLGRDQIKKVACIEDTEAMNVGHLAQLLDQSDSKGKIVIASAGTVTGTDFDDLEVISKLCKKHNAWLHVDGAFGLFTRMFEDKQYLTKGIEFADSITSDGHKWLNVPYDCGIFFTRHIGLLQQACSVAAPYLDVGSTTPSFMDRGIENSRRFRALPVWMSLKAYGLEGQKELVANNIRQAKALSDWIDQSNEYEMLTPCKMNIVLFRPAGITDAEVAEQLDAINRSGQTYMTPGQWKGKPAIRAAFSNWSTSDHDLEIIIDVLRKVASQR